MNVISDYIYIYVDLIQQLYEGTFAQQGAKIQKHEGAARPSVKVGIL